MYGICSVRERPQLVPPTALDGTSCCVTTGPDFSCDTEHAFESKSTATHRFLGKSPRCAKARPWTPHIFCAWPKEIGGAGRESRTGVVHACEALAAFRSRPPSVKFRQSLRGPSVKFRQTRQRRQIPDRLFVRAGDNLRSGCSLEAGREMLYTVSS